MLDLGQLQSFREVAERGTVADAARALGYTPPAISQHLAKLERELGSILFDRAGGRLLLTEAGRRLLPIAHEMADVADRVRSSVAAPIQNPHLVIAGFASAITTIVVPRLAHLTQTMKLDIVEAEDADAMRDLSLGTVDLVLTQEYEGTPLDHDPRFVFAPLLRDELKLVLPTGSPSSMRVADVASEAWLLNGQGTRCALATEQLLLVHGVTPTVSGVVNDNTTLLSLVAAGHGVAVVPSLVLDDSPSEVVVSEQRLGVERTIFAVRRRVATATVRDLIHGLTMTRTG